jgi:hypothetical protein
MRRFAARQGLAARRGAQERGGGRGGGGWRHPSRGCQGGWGRARAGSAQRGARCRLGAARDGDRRNRWAGRDRAGLDGMGTRKGVWRGARPTRGWGGRGAAPRALPLLQAPRQPGAGAPRAAPCREHVSGRRPPRSSRGSQGSGTGAWAGGVCPGACCRKGRGRGAAAESRRGARRASKGGAQWPGQVGARGRGLGMAVPIWRCARPTDAPKQCPRAARARRGARRRRGRKIGVGLPAPRTSCGRPFRRRRRRRRRRVD